MLRLRHANLGLRVKGRCTNEIYGAVQHKSNTFIALHNLCIKHQQIQHLLNFQPKTDQVLTVS